MLVNMCERTEMLRALQVGDSTLWVVDRRGVNWNMKSFTATAIRLGIKVSQKTWVVSRAGYVSFEVIEVTREK